MLMVAQCSSVQNSSVCSVHLLAEADGSVRRLNKVLLRWVWTGWVEAVHRSSVSLWERGSGHIHLGSKILDDVEPELVLSWFRAPERPTHVKTLTDVKPDNGLHPTSDRPLTFLCSRPRPSLNKPAAAAAAESMPRLCRSIKT